MRLALRAVATLLAALVMWPAVAVAQASEAEPGRAACEDAAGAFELLCAAYELLSTQYVEEVPDEDLASAAARGVREAGLAPRGDEPAPVCALPAPAFEQVCAEIDAVGDAAAAVWAASQEMFDAQGDPYTFLMSPQAYEAWLSRLGVGVSYSGIGLSLGLLDGTVPCRALSETCRLAVAEVFANSPAARAGLMADDVILELGGLVPAGSGCGLGGLRSFEPGSVVTLRVERDGQVLSFTMEADRVYAPVVSSRIVVDKIGYLRLDSFSLHSDRQVARQLEALLDSRVETLVVDLRGNPGGYLQTVINIASLFLNDQQVIIQEVSRLQTLLHLVSGHGSAPNPGALPIVVAVDGSSASASEVMTLALRDHGRATVVGTTTFGKNTGQVTQAVESRDGDLLGGARVTVFRWLGPAGESASGGIEPHVELDLSGCLHPIGLARRAAAAAGLQGGVPADLEVGSERFRAVETLVADGVLAGTECQPGLLCPGDPVPRWMLAVWLARVLDGEDPEPVSESSFVDVDPEQWWAAHVERLAELGVTVGCASEPARYCPDSPVTRAQMASFLKRAFQLDPAVPAGFADTRRNHHAAAIDALFAVGITKGCADDPLRFCPDEATTRGQMALFLNRAVNRFN